MIELRHIVKTYGMLSALQSVDLRIQAGLTTVLIGPSGCGKSTLLRLIIGLVAADSGAVYFKGIKVLPPIIMALRQKMGYVIQEGGLFPNLTARDNVTLMARHLKWDRDRIDRRLAELTALTRFPPDGLDRYPARLSGGQRQRVSLMRALMLDPDVLLMDEPLGALDPMIRTDLQTDLQRIFRRLAKTVVLVTHDLAEAAFFGDVLVLLREGKIVQQGTFDEFLRSPVEPFVTDFINAQRHPLGGIGREA